MEKVLDLRETKLPLEDHLHCVYSLDELYLNFKKFIKKDLALQSEGQVETDYSNDEIYHCIKTIPTVHLNQNLITYDMDTQIIDMANRVSVDDFWLYRAFHYFYDKSDIANMQDVIDHGLDILAMVNKGREGYSEMDYLLFAPNGDVIDFLIEHGLNINATKNHYCILLLLTLSKNETDFFAFALRGAQFVFDFDPHGIEMENIKKYQSEMWEKTQKGNKIVEQIKENKERIKSLIGYTNTTRNDDFNSLFHRIYDNLNVFDNLEIFE